MLTAGIDVGSVNTKVVIYDVRKGQLVASQVTPTGMKPREQAERTFTQLLKKTGLTGDDIALVMATGYARQAVNFAQRTLTEITATAIGINHWHPGARTVIDIGGQDSKVITIDENGRVREFVMNDRCAAGTGSFLEFIARAIGVPIDQFGELSQQSERPVLLSSLCVVMAESEILSLVAADTPVPDIIAGLHQALASRIVNIAAGLPLLPEVIFTGGTALNEGLRLALSRLMGLPVQRAAMPLLAAALGAAIAATDGLTD